MKVVLRILGVLLVVVVIAAAAASWYFSNLIIAGATIDGPTEDYVNEVTAVASDGPVGTITYLVEDSIEDPATEDYTTSVTGMRFEDGGYLQLGQGADVEGRAVTRPFVLLEGTVPAVGALGQFDWNSYPNPEALGATSTEVTYRAPGGPTRAIIVDPATEATGTWVVVAHGRNGSIREGLRAVPLYAQRGLTTMLINYRDDQKEDGVPQEDGIGNFGLTEWEDLQAAVQYAVDEGARDVILVGWSMGGAVVASYLENGSNTDAVLASHLVSPAVSFSDIVVFGAEQMGIPTAPLAPVVWLAKTITQWRVNIDFDAVEYKDNAETWPVPTAVTAASRDDLVPPESIEAFAEQLPDGAFAYFEDASHTGEWNHDSAKFDAFIGDWLDEVTAG